MLLDWQSQLLCAALVSILKITGIQPKTALAAILMRRVLLYFHHPSENSLLSYVKCYPQTRWRDCMKDNLINQWLERLTGLYCAFLAHIVSLA